MNFAEFVQQECPQLVQAQSFDEDHWRREIQTALDSAIAEDRGALLWCRKNRFELYRQCTGALRAVDNAFESKNAKEVERALDDFLRTCRETVGAMRKSA